MKNLVVLYTPIGASYLWQTEEANLRKTPRELRWPYEEEDGAGPGCGSCTYEERLEEGREEREEERMVRKVLEEGVDGGKTLKDYHMEVLPYVEQVAGAIYDRVMESDAILRASFVRQGSQTASAMVENVVYAQYSGKDFPHALLRTVVYDRLANLLEDTCNAASWKQVAYAGTNRTEHSCMTPYMNIRKNWVKTIRDLADLLVKKKQHDNNFRGGEEGEQHLSVLGKTMVSLNRFSQKSGYESVIMNLLSASLGLEALMSVEGRDIGGRETNLYSVLL